MNEYTIKVSRQGKLEKTVHGIVARTAWAAIDFVQELIGDEDPEVKVNPTTGKMCVTGWSGFMYVARQTS